MTIIFRPVVLILQIRHAEVKVQVVAEKRLHIIMIQSQVIVTNRLPANVSQDSRSFFRF